MIDRKVFLATTMNGIARAAQDEKLQWAVEVVLQGHVNCLAADPSDNSVVYAGTQGQGVFRSIDAGKSWQHWSMDGEIVKAVAVSPHDSSVVYAGTKPAYVFISRDGGSNWQELESFRHIRGRSLWFSPAEKPFKAYVQAISVSPTDPNIVVAGIEFGAVVRSTDGGRSWSNHLKGSLRDCHEMRFHAANGNWIYESGGSGGGVSFSKDSGETWKKVKDGLDRNYGWACAADPEKPEIWYASLSPMAGFPSMAPAAHIDGKANAYIFRASGGAPWQKLRGGLPDPLNYMAYSLVTIPGYPGAIYAGLADGNVWHSTDYGDNWNQLPFNLEDVHRQMIILNPAN